MTKRLLSGAAVAALAAWPSAARADDGLVDITFDVDGVVRATSNAGTVYCTGPCTLRVARGFVQVRTERTAREIFVEGSVHVHESRGAPAVRSAGLVVLVAGALVTIASVAIPLVFCRTDYDGVDALGRPRVNENPCRDISDGVKVAWIAGGGVGLTAAITGGILYGTSGPGLRVASPPVGAGAMFTARF